MTTLGQASGGFRESSSALRILYVGVRNSIGDLTDDAFTQTNPPIVTTVGTVSDNVHTEVLGVLSGSIAFSRPDQGPLMIGGPAEPGAGVPQKFIKPLGLYINNAVGNPYENTPGPASGKGPYVSGLGTYASQLFETQALGATTGGTPLAPGGDLTYMTGQELIASRNGYLMPKLDGSDGITSTDNAACASQVANGQGSSTILAVLKMPSDSQEAEIVFDQRI